MLIKDHPKLHAHWSLTTNKSFSLSDSGESVATSAAATIPRTIHSSELQDSNAYQQRTLLFVNNSSLLSPSSLSDS
ncbi:hypothetical protein D5086_010835 [Populus alba]|uniref:Uncharacterized protein n=1 Tax=Populus alba TaxID=43335 RepID=A0ACC4CBP6_POPAL